MKSYNMKSITGFYSLKTTDYPIISQPHTEEYIIEQVITLNGVLTSLT